MNQRTVGLNYDILGIAIIQQFQKIRPMGCIGFIFGEIPKIAKIVVLTRQNYSIKSLSPIVKKRMDKKDWIFINSKKINISSSLIKKL